MDACSIFVGIPTIDGSIQVECMLSLFKAIEHLTAQGHSVSVHPLIGDSLVCRARNFLCNSFYRQPEKYTHLFFLDSDIEFPPDLISKLLSANAPIATAAYAKKRFDMENIASKVEAYKKAFGREPASIEEMSPLLVHSNLNLPVGNDHRIVNGFVDTKDSATGLMLIRHDALKRIVDAFGDEIAYRNDVTVAGSGIGGVPFERGQLTYNFFEVAIDPTDRRLLSEDYSFCRRFQNAGGGNIPMLVSATTVHHGRASYRCNQLVKWSAEGAFQGTESPH